MTILDEVIQGEGERPLFGLSCGSYNPVAVEIAAYLGYDALWIEMEHGHITYAQTADLCRIAAGVGLITMIRIPDSRRENVLKAAECGPDMIDLPMANSPDVVEELVRHARYAPEGSRGFFGSSRAVRYTINGDVAGEQRRINRELCLVAQIETREAVENAKAICSVKGLDAVFLGPGDMSASLGVTGDTGHPLVKDALARAVVVAKSHGKRVAMACPAADVGEWAQQGVDLFFCIGDFSALRDGARAALDRARESLRA